MSNAIDRLYADILACRGKDPGRSRTAKLIQDGIPKMAKKVAEEAVEVSLDAVAGNRHDVILESVDLIYNLGVLWAELDIRPADVWAEMERRERLYGMCEKLPKSDS
ncbi:phosphoribosyl-ATP diphosphatase [Terrihabitans sp. B22-R8]|uniref:phosphoribosyl-ATP diphosphatase n=1 Tax=Terrihabitans sp. B22-R8 TaxID=3425128 RepID=UPI00403C8C7A